MGAKAYYGITNSLEHIVKTPVAITAMAHGFTHVTNNEKDFNSIKGLKIVNPF